MAYINYLLLDAALMGEHHLQTAKLLNSSFYSLLNQEFTDKAEYKAPYIFRFEPNSSFAKWYMEVGWGNGWGVMARSFASLQELRLHFRKFILVLSEDNQEIYFRFYNPEVLRIFLPTFTFYQLKDFFGPIDYFMLENAVNKDAEVIWIEDGRLYFNPIEKKEVEQRFRSEIFSIDKNDSREESGFPKDSGSTGKVKLNMNKSFKNLVNYSADRTAVIIDMNDDKKVKRNRFFFEE